MTSVAEHGPGPVGPPGQEPCPGKSGWTGTCVADERKQEHGAQVHKGPVTLQPDQSPARQSGNTGTCVADEGKKEDGGQVLEGPVTLQPDQSPARLLPANIQGRLPQPAERQEAQNPYGEYIILQFRKTYLFQDRMILN